MIDLREDAILFITSIAPFNRICCIRAPFGPAFE